MIEDIYYSKYLKYKKKYLELKQKGGASTRKGLWNTVTSVASIPYSIVSDVTAIGSKPSHDKSVNSHPYGKTVSNIGSIIGNSVGLVDNAKDDIIADANMIHGVTIGNGAFNALCKNTIIRAAKCHHCNNDKHDTCENERNAMNNSCDHKYIDASLRKSANKLKTSTYKSPAICSQLNTHDITTLDL